MRSDAELIAAARAGSADAFTELVRGYRQGLLRFLVTRCASRADAEDALQDTLINAYRYIASYDSRWRFSTWLYRIAIRNAARNASPASEQLDDIGDDGADPLAHCIAASDRENLWRHARQVLSDETFTAMWLRYIEDMSINDIAKTLDRSVSWTKVNLSRGRKALEAAMTREAAKARSEAYG